MPLPIDGFVDLVILPGGLSWGQAVLLATTGNEGAPIGIAGEGEWQKSQGFQ
jgi:hypothetical protein